jgi:hypothetical protein
MFMSWQRVALDGHGRCSGCCGGGGGGGGFDNYHDNRMQLIQPFSFPPWHLIGRKKRVRFMTTIHMVWGFGLEKSEIKIVIKQLPYPVQKPKPPATSAKCHNNQNWHQLPNDKHDKNNSPLFACSPEQTWKDTRH